MVVVVVVVVDACSLDFDACVEEGKAALAGCKCSSIDARVSVD